MTPLRLAVLVAITALTFTTHADPDLWGHVRFGQDILTARAIPGTDPYSFTSDRPWVNHEWLAEVVMAATYQLGGSLGLVLLKFALVLIMLAIVLRSLGHDRLPPVPRDFLLFLAVAASFTRIVAVRPQLVSLVLFCGLLALLKRSERQRRVLLSIPILFLVWVNVHGGWLVGLGTLLVWSIARLVSPTTPTTEGWWVASVAVLAALATVANPYGTGMWAFLHETVGFGRPGIQDWEPIIRLPLGFVMPWALSLLTALFAVSRGGWPPNPARTLVCLVLAVGSARISRLDAFFGLSVVVLLAPQVASAWARLGTRREQREPSRTAGSPAGRALRVVLPAAAVAAGLAMARDPTCVTINPTWAPEADVVNVISAQTRGGRMLTWFDWGQYAIWSFGPDMKVSLDGRRETVYTDKILGEHLDFYFDRAPSRDLADRLTADLIWVPSTLPIVSRLTREGWVVIYRGPSSVVLSREPASSPLRTTAGTAAARCFPGP